RRWWLGGRWSAIAPGGASSPYALAALGKDPWRPAGEAARLALERGWGARQAERAGAVAEAVWQAGEEAVRRSGAARVGPAAVRAVRRVVERRAREQARRAEAQAEARARDADLAGQCALLREVFGNPFRHSPFDPGALAGGGEVVALARAIYQGRDFASLPVLADALEEAGRPQAAPDRD